MEYLTLNNGIQMPLVGFGTFMLGGEICTNAVAAAIQNGYRMIDTAEAYDNEKEVGEEIRQSGIDRKKLFLVTKVNFKSYENAEQTILQSLANLQTDYIDLLLLHWPFANYYAAWRVLEKLYAEGKAYAPLGQGSRGEMFQEPTVLALAEKYGKTPAQILLRFLMQKDIIVIPRSTKPEHIRENFGLFDFALTADEMIQLSALDKKEPLIGRPETPELVEFSLTW